MTSTEKHVPPAFDAANEQIRLFVLLGLMLIAFFMRINSLARESLWLDEVFSIRFVSMRSLLHVIRDTFSEDYHPFSYYALLKVWTSAFGMGDTMCRLLSVFIGTSTIPFLYLIARRVFRDGLSGLLAAAFMAVSPMHIWYSQECRMYVLLIFTFAACLYFLIRVLDEDFPWLHTLLFYLAYIVFAYGHATSGIIGLSFFVPAILFLRVKHTDSDRSTRSQHTSSFKRHLFLAGGCVILYIPWMIRLLTLQQVDREIASLKISGIFSLFRWLLFFQHDLSRIIVLSVVVVFLVLIVLLIRLQIRKNTLHGIILLIGAFVLPILTTMVLCLWKPFYQSHYLSFLYVPLILLIAGGISATFTVLKTLDRSPVRIALKGLIVCVLIGLLAISVRITISDLQEGKQKDVWRDAVTSAAERIEPGDHIGFLPSWVRICFEHYFFGYVDKQPVLAKQSGYKLAKIYFTKTEERFTGSIERLLKPEGSDSQFSVWIFYANSSGIEPVEKVLFSRGYEIREMWSGTGIVVKAYELTGNEG